MWIQLLLLDYNNVTVCVYGSVYMCVVRVCERECMLNALQKTIFTLQQFCVILWCIFDGYCFWRRWQMVLSSEISLQTSAVSVWINVCVVLKLLCHWMLETSAIGERSEFFSHRASWFVSCWSSCCATDWSCVDFVWLTLFGGRHSVVEVCPRALRWMEMISSASPESLW